MTKSSKKWLVLLGTVMVMLATANPDHVRVLGVLRRGGFGGHGGPMVVTDSLNDRVLIFNPPFTTEENASIVLGQSSFTTYATGTTASTLSAPTNATVDSSGNLWVTDFGNSRILEYTAPFSNGMSASVVIGQANFTDGGTSATASTMNSPAGSTFDSSGHLWVSDYDNNRVLRFTPPFSNGMSADLVLGQANFTAHTCTTGASGLCEPWVGVRFDSNGESLGCRLRALPGTGIYATLLNQHGCLGGHWPSQSYKLRLRNHGNNK